MAKVIEGAHLAWAEISHATDLARLAKQVVRALGGALAAQRAQPNDDQLRVIRFSKAPQGGISSPGLYIGTVLDHLELDEDFQRMCRESVFAAGCSGTKKKQAACVGGRIVKDTESSLHTSLASMRSSLTSAFREFGAPFNEDGKTSLVIEAANVKTWLLDIAKGMSKYGLQDAGNADVHSIILRDAPVDTVYGSPIGVHLVATEEGPSRSEVLKQLEAALSRWFTDHGSSTDPDYADDVAYSVRKWMLQAEVYGSDMDKFVDFLRTDVLSRIRLAVTMMIIEHLAESVTEETRAFREYAIRIVQIFKESVDAAKPYDIAIDVPSILSANGSFNLLDVTGNASFWEKLPVISSWEFPVAEDEVKDATYDRREVSYAFKVNGESSHHPKPEFGFKTSYEVQVESALKHIQDEASLPFTRAKALALLLVLDALLPHSNQARTDNPLKSIEVRVAEISGMKADEVALLFSNRLLGKMGVGVDGIRSVTLKDINDIANGVVTAAWSSVGPNTRLELLKEFERKQTYQVIVRDGMIDLSAIGAQRTHPLLLVTDKGREKDFEKVQWLKMVRVIRSSNGNRVSGGAERLLSMEVKVAVRPRVAYAHTSKSVRTERILNGASVVTAAFLPRYSSHVGGRHGHEKSAFELLKAQRAGRPGFTLTYGVEQLVMKPPYNQEAGQEYAAKAAALTMLSMLALDMMLDNAKQKDQSTPLHAMLFRLQFRSGNEDVQPGTAEHVAYALSQAVEHAMSRRVTTKLQGMATSSRDDKDLDMRRQKSFMGLLSGFGMKMPSSAPAGTRVGFVFFASRPCDSEVWTMNSGTSHAVFGRSYMASFDGKHVSLTKVPGSSSVHTGDTAGALSESVGGIVERLAALGCTQVAIVSHAHGSLTLEKTRSSRAQGHNNRQFLHDLYGRYPNLTFYHLMCGTQRMMRAKSVISAAACYEARGLEAHLDSGASDTRTSPVFRAGLRPLYSMGTLKIVGKRKQSGFMTYHMVRLEDGASETPSALRAVNALVNGPQQLALLDALRAIHFMEYESGSIQNKSYPVLEPMSWMRPDTSAGAGEVVFLGAGKSTRRKGEVKLSLTAIAARTAAVLDALRDLPTITLPEKIV